MTSSAYATAVALFSQLANLFFWPVAIALLVLFTWALADVGRLLYQAWRRRREPSTELVDVAQRLKAQSLGGAWHRPDLEGASMSPSLRRFWSLVEDRLAALDDDEHVDLWLDEVLQQEEVAISSSLDRSRAMVRIGPMLGLAGTIIPLGPALQSLLGGDMAAMVNHLVVGFGAVVCGLMLSGIAYGITLVRERWARVDLKDMENLCELIVRGRKTNATDLEAAYARV